jgi:hypothetical protein
MKYRKKPVVVEAVQWRGGNIEEIQSFMADSDRGPIYMPGFSNSDEIIGIETLEGRMIANIGDYIIKGVSGEFYPCKSDIFDKTYDAV